MADDRQVLFEADSIIVWYWPTHGLIHHFMRDYTRGDAFRQALEAGLTCLRANGAKRWLSDDRANNVLPKDDEHWARTDWFPRTRQAGWKYWAIVKPVKILGEMHLRRYAETYAQHGVTARFYSDPDEAFDWIITPDPTAQS
jgi:hypothetical protein